MTQPRVVAVLESMWDWRARTSSAGYSSAPRWFRINPDNYSGRRLYRLVGTDVDLRVVNSCRELVPSAKHHGTPDPVWLAECLAQLDPIDLLLLCGAVAQSTYARTGLDHAPRLSVPHPAARRWTTAAIVSTSERIRDLLE